MEQVEITEDAVSSHLICHRKSYQILFKHDAGEDRFYANFLRKKIKEVESLFFGSEKKCMPFYSDQLTGKCEIVLNASINYENLVVKNVHLRRQYSKSKLGNYSYEPLIFTSSNKVNPEDKIRALFIGYVLHKIQGTKPEKAAIILIDGSMKSIKLDNDIHFPIIKELKDWINFESEIPPIAFNKHCPLCSFEQRCITIAEKEDSISLLWNVTHKIRKKFESKGIFTIKQLSYLYKPRRRSRSIESRKPTHQYELQALAIRTQKIYTDDILEPQKADIEIYVDINVINLRPACSFDNVVSSFFYDFAGICVPVLPVRLL